VPTKILVADDSATMRRVLEMTFAGEDARVLSVDSGDAAVNKASELMPDIVFADASMGGGGGMDGYEVARRIKSNPQLARVAVIVMASQHTPYDDGKGRAAGVDDHIPKPFDTQSVIDKVAQVLARPRAMPASAGAEAARPAPPAAAASAARPAPVGAPPPPARSAVGSATRMGIGGPVPAPAPARPAPMPAAASAAPQPVRSAAPAPAAAAVAAPAPAPARPAPAPAPAPAAAIDTAAATMAQKLSSLGLSREQVEGVLALSREVVEQVVWEVVPVLAEQLIKEEIKRLTTD
jgi:CheY-like chemotaxis protein